MEKDNFQILEECLTKLSNDIKVGNIITSESDLKCYLYSELKGKFKDDLFIEHNGSKYSKIVTEISYNHARSKKDNFADIIMVNGKDLHIYKDGDFRMEDEIVESLVIELKFADVNWIGTKKKKILEDCKKILCSGNISNACVILVDIEGKDHLRNEDLEDLGDSLVKEFKDKFQKTTLAFYYITGRGSPVKVEPLKGADGKTSIRSL